jgi:hypothetical protein
MAVARRPNGTGWPPQSSPRRNPPAFQGAPTAGFESLELHPSWMLLLVLAARPTPRLRETIKPGVERLPVRGHEVVQ